MGLDGEPTSLAGKLLVASPLIVEPTFYRAVILMLEHNSDGAYGLVLNRRSDEPVVEHLPGWRDVVGEPGMIHIGGPVDPAIGTGLCPGETDIATALPGVWLVNLEQTPPSSVGGVRIYSGYSGWSASQLELELVEGAWYVVAASPDDPFSDPADQWLSLIHI